MIPGNGDPSPFFWEPPPASASRSTGAQDLARPRAALVLHGFTGTPFEVRPIAIALAEAGYAVAAPVLAGHGGTVEALEATRWPDWLAGAEREANALRARVRPAGASDAKGAPLFIVGFSLGGLLALRLALRRPDDVAAVAILAPPLRLRRASALAVRLVARLPRTLRRGILRTLPKRAYDVFDEEMQRRNPGLPALPLAGVASLLELGRMVRADLPHIRTPALVAHGVRDRTVPPANGREVGERLGSTEVERLWLPRSGHLLGIDLDRAALIAAILDFFGRHGEPR
jgi:carboxylesterase